MKHPYNHRLRLGEFAQRQGIKPAPRAFQTSVLTVRKWLRRYQQECLRERSRTPHQTPAALEQRGVGLRRQLLTFGAARLKGEFDLPPSHVTIGRILRAHGLLQKRRRKYQRTQDVAQVKACWRLFQQLSADTKDLQDIRPYWPQAQRLPLIQYAAGEVRSGLLFLAFAQRRSASASAVFAARMQRHLARYGVECATWSGKPTTALSSSAATTNGGFPAALGESQHVRIPPAAHTYNSDVETGQRGRLLWALKMT